MARRTRRAGAGERPPAAVPAIVVEQPVPPSPHKRRRLSASASASSSARRSSPPVTRSAAGALNTSAACASCHRRPARAAELLTCPRCEAVVCTVCTRTCTSSGPASLPPTPQLSYSATPVDGSPFGSPQRPALALAVDYPEAAASKRRRMSAGAVETRDAHDHLGVGLGLGTVASVVGGDGRWAEDLMLGEGCGRTVCKACAVEYENDDTTTCFDCYGIPLSVPPRPAFSGMPGSFDFAFSPDEGTATPALSPSPAPTF